MIKTLPLDNNLLEEGAKVLRALNNPFRQKIIRLLHQRGRINFKQMKETLHLDQSFTSLQLKILRQQGLVYFERENRETFYALNYERFAAIDQLVKGVVYRGFL